MDRLGLARLGQVKLGQVRLGQVRLEIEILEQCAVIAKMRKKSSQSGFQPVTLQGI